jgi:hypothetical protein
MAQQCNHPSDTPWTDKQNADVLLALGRPPLLVRIVAATEIDPRDMLPIQEMAQHQRR